MGDHPVHDLVLAGDARLDGDRERGVKLLTVPYPALRAATSAVGLIGALDPAAFAERWVGTLRRECLDWTLILSRRHLHAVVTEYVDHYNQHRPHRALRLVAPAAPAHEPVPTRAVAPEAVRRLDHLGGLLHEDQCAA